MEVFPLSSHRKKAARVFLNTSSMRKSEEVDIEALEGAPAGGLWAW